MATGNLLRNITLTARGGHDLKDVEFMGRNDPYLVLELEGQRVETEVDRNGGENPVWNQCFKFVLPMEKPGQAAPVLRVSVMNSNRLLPDREIGSGSLALASLVQGKGTDEVQVPLTDKSGKTAGWVMVQVQLELGDTTSLGSAAGTTLGTVHTPVGGVPENALPPASQDALREAQAVEPGPLSASIPVHITSAPAVGPTAGASAGQVMNPSAPGFGAGL